MAPSLRDGSNFSRTKISELRFFRKNFPFVSHRPHFSDFPFFFQILRIFTLLNVVDDPFFTRKGTISEKNFLTTLLFYSVRTFARTRQHYFSKYWGDGCMGRPPPQILGETVPPVPLGLRPCRLRN